MELTVHTGGEDVGRDLYDWLVNDAEVVRDVRVTAAGHTSEGTMGSGFELLNLIIPNVIALGGLGVSIATFLQQRRAGGGPEPTIRVQVDGDLVLLGTDAEEVLGRLFRDELERARQAETADDR